MCPLAGCPRVLLLSAGTDGTDGPTDAAGAFATGSSLSRARARGLSVKGSLADNDSYAFFLALEDLLKTGPTRTNVMDLQVILVAEAGLDPIADVAAARDASD